MKTSLLFLTIVAICTAQCMHAHAGFVYENFDYADGQDITTVSSSASGLGDWTTSTGGIIGTTSSTGLAFGSLNTSGGSLNITKPTGGGWQFLAASITAGGAIADGTTLYASYLFKFAGPNGGEGTARNFGVSVGNDIGADHTLALLAQSYFSNPNGARIGYTDGDANQFASGDIFDGATYLFVGKWTNLGGASNSVGWILNVANLNAISGDGSITEAELIASNIATGAETADVAAGSFGVAQYVKIGDFMDSDVNFVVDELRFSETLNGVLPVVPEPTALVLLVSGIGLLLARRS